ncbi:MAG TPA: protein kinase [Gemmatimonadaceae bacterium]
MSELPTKHPTDPSKVSSTEQTDKLLERLRDATRGHYDIYGELGRGGMATVYLAHEISLDRKVAIKVMSPAMVHGAGLVERFKREARTAANLAHPNIIPIYAVREVDDLLFCVIKLVQGTPLDAIMRELDELPIRMVQAILAQVGDALAYAHRHGVVHRDVKPGNILIDDDGWAVVTDFGIAKVPEMEGLTMTGVAVGTPTYMSPEQGAGGEVTGASDQYSLGVVAYEMLTGRPPFTGTSMMSILYSHFHDAPPPLETLRPDCPASLRNAVMRMLSKDPADRWPSLADAIVAMEARPLDRDDPTRDHLISLVRTGENHRIVSSIQTPRSPIPLVNQRRKSSESIPAAKPRWRPALFGIAAAVLLGAGYLIASFDVRGRQAGSQVATETGGVVAKDTVAAAGARRDSSQVVAPPPSAPAPNARDTGRDPGVLPNASQRKPAASAAKLRSDSAAAKAAVVQAPPNAATPDSAALQASTKRDSAAADSPAIRTQVNPVPITTPPRPSSVAPPAVDEQAAVRALILAFARALGASDLATARRLYPSMPNEQRQGFEALWRGGATLTPRWTISDIVVDGNVATARIRGTNAVNQRGTPSEVPVDLRARLERRGGEWRLVALVN